MKVAIIADIHANSLALDQVFSDIEINDCEKILVLGDLVGYYYYPSNVIDKIRNDSRCVTIRGNHEDLLLRAIKDSSFAHKCYLKYGSGLNIAIETLSLEQLDWIQSLPESMKIDIDGKKIGLHHGSDTDINEYIYPNTRLERIESMKTNNDYLFFGHTHYPAIFTNSNTIIVNPGSVGQPRDIGSLSSYVILDTANSSIVFRRVPFSNKNLIKEVKIKDPHYPYLAEIFERNNS